MLQIKSLNNEVLPVLDIGQPERFSDLDGTDTLSLTIRETALNSKAFAYIEDEASLIVEDDEYIITNMKPRVSGGSLSYEIEAVHNFFHDLSGHFVYDIIPDRIVLSLHQALTHILPKDYTFIIHDDFKNIPYEDFGEDYSLSLFETIRVDFNFEYIKDGAHIIIYEKIGSKTNKQMRYKHNIIDVEGGLNSTNLATYIKGTGKPKEDSEGNEIEGEFVVEAEYTSPLAETYGIIHAEPIADKRFTKKKELIEYMKSKLSDTIDISYNITYDEFIKSLYDDGEINLGDGIYLIHEILKENFGTRIVSITDYPFSDSLKPIYTISSKKESIIDRQVKSNSDKKNLEDKVSNLDRTNTDT